MTKKYESLWPYPQQITSADKFPRPESVRVQGDFCRQYLDDITLIGKVRLGVEQNCYPLELMLDTAASIPGSYTLNMSATGARIAGADRAGIMYGLQTWLQILGLHRGDDHWPALTVHDWPAYRKRCFMIDMGRSVFPISMIKRIIRILARLKMNQLHLHLSDDELCGLRFEGLPFGSENPYSISLSDLAELVSYAAEYEIEVVPEIESWGHVGSLVYHRPELRGGAGMYDGVSFLICQQAFDLVKELVRQVAEVMPKQATIHFGMDEAKWFTAPSLGNDFKPENLVRNYFDMLQSIAAMTGKDLTMRLWADHGGRPVPPDIQSKVIIEPWNYWIKNRDMIDKAIEHYSGSGKMRWMMGAGQSMAQYRGAFHATRYWCRRALNSPNVEGVNITFWGENDLADKLITLFAGAYYAWNPTAPTGFCDNQDYEHYDSLVFPIMRRWQNMFVEARTDKMQDDQGPFVYGGYYLYGRQHGQPVAPTVLLAGTSLGHDFINEGM